MTLHSDGGTVLPSGQGTKHGGEGGLAAAPAAATAAASANAPHVDGRPRSSRAMHSRPLEASSPSPPPPSSPPPALSPLTSPPPLPHMTAQNRTFSGTIAHVPLANVGHPGATARRDRTHTAGEAQGTVLAWRRSTQLPPIGVHKRPKKKQQPASGGPCRHAAMERSSAERRPMGEAVGASQAVATGIRTTMTAAAAAVEAGQNGRIVRR